MLEALFNTIVYPIQIIINIAFINITDLFNINCGIAIIGVSFIVSLLCLPMYDKAHKLQEEENAIQKKMEPKIRSIKKNFRGDERHMMISAYYRENHYSPFMALRNSLSLFIQIPFFIAAYLFFSHLPVLQGQHFLFLSSLSKPDDLIHIGNCAINFMPVLMTAINIAAGEIYTKGHNARERVQIYGVALIFLVLLYNAPSGLVLYWTFNNIFSLFKNISYRMKNPVALLYGAFWLIYAGILIFWFVSRKMFYYNYCTFGLYALILGLMPYLIKKFGAKVSDFIQNIFEDTKGTTLLMMLLGLGNFVLLGCMIPFNVVAASPVEFSYLGDFSSPLYILAYPVFQALGIFVFWPFCIYKMFPSKVKNVLILVLGGIFFAGILNYYVFNVDYGTLSSTLVLENAAAIVGFNPVRESLNIMFDIFIIVVFIVLICYKKQKIVNNGLMIFIITGLILTAYNGVKIQKEFLQYKIIKNEVPKDSKSLAPFVNMTKTGKNVVIFMFDRAISSFLPIIFEQRPDLIKAFDGFTYYPNTVSYSSHTITAAAPLYGGYEYTPEMQNLKTDRLMSDKHTEAIFVLPTLFMKNNWEATMCDAPLAEHKWVANPLTFTSKGIKYENLIGKYTTKYKFEHTYHEEMNDGTVLSHNLLFFSFMNIAPIPKRGVVYQGGRYWSALFYDKNIKTNTRTGLDNYSALYYLPDITIADSNKNEFFFLQNELTHTDFNLEYPDFVPKVNITNLGEDFFHDSKTYMRYQTNMAMVMLTAKWLNKLRELGVYDNTRIIFVSDHGIEVRLPQYDKFMNERITPYNPILLMKDFNAKGDLKTDNAFMTNADIPYYATLGLFEQVNPMTNKKFTTAPKAGGVNILLDLKRSPEEFENANCIDEKSRMWHVKNDITKKGNWSVTKPSALQLEKGKEGKKLKGKHASSRFGSRDGQEVEEPDAKHSKVYDKSK